MSAVERHAVALRRRSSDPLGIDRCGAQCQQRCLEVGGEFGDRQDVRAGCKQCSSSRIRVSVTEVRVRVGDGEPHRAGRCGFAMSNDREDQHGQCHDDQRSRSCEGPSSGERCGQAHRRGHEQQVRGESLQAVHDRVAGPPNGLSDDDRSHHSDHRPCHHRKRRPERAGRGWWCRSVIVIHRCRRTLPAEMIT